MDFLIDHKRFKKQFNQKDLIKHLPSKNKIVKFPLYKKDYYNFANNYLKNKNRLTKNICPCSEDNDVLISLTDRNCINFVTVICKSCGLMRVKDYIINKYVIDFYENYYQKFFNVMTPNDKFDYEKNNSKHKYDLLNNYKIKPFDKLKIVDLGGGAGGMLDHFGNNNEKYLFDYHDPFLKFAETKGIKSIKGGLDKIDFKPDILILSHVIEHWDNFQVEIKKLIDIQKKGETLNYIEFPSLDSIKKGRMEGDILGDIHVPHVYYFTSYVFENLMNRYGFEKVYMDTSTKSIFVYTGNKKNLINHFNQCKKDLIYCEKIRKFQIFKNIIKFLLPLSFIKLIRKIRKKL